MSSRESGEAPDSGTEPKLADRGDAAHRTGGNGPQHRGVMVAEPPVRLTATSDLEFYRRKQNVVAIRHVSGDHLVAMIEIISRGNKSGRMAFDDLVRKAADLLFHQIHLLIVDLQPPTRRDPHGVHGAIWDEVAGEPYTRPADKPLTLAAHEAGTSVRAFIEPACVGDKLSDMPLFLEPGRYIAVPLEETYQAAFAPVPRALADLSWSRNAGICGSGVLGCQGELDFEAFADSTTMVSTSRNKSLKLEFSEFDCTSF